MKTTEKLALGLLAGAGALWGTRAFLRHRRWMDLSGRVVVITGADGGFGLILARQVAQAGAVVVLAARNAEALETAAADLRSHGAQDALAVPTDVSDEDQARRLILTAAERFGRIDVLLNNAGLMLVGAVPTLTIEDFRSILNTNFWGTVNPTMAALPIMREQQFGRIANVVSVGGRFVIPHMAPYIASKFALTGFTRAIRAEASRDNVLVTGIYPATIRTGGHTHAWFKGDTQGEYRWFALADTLPGLSTSAEAAATQAIRAIQGGDPEVIIGLAARLNVAFDGLFPDWSAELMALLERAMPAPADLDAPAVQGREIRGEIADFVNRLVPSAARP